MAIERVGNLGYCALITEATIGTAITPTVYTLLDNETMTTMYNLEDEMPIAGIPIETFQVLPGLRSHKGDIEIVAEPNTATHLFDMLLTRGTLGVTYTFTVTSANATIGATYTNNAQTFTVLATIAAATTLICSGTGAPAASGTLTKATGTGDATIAFSASVAGNDIWPFTLSSTTLPKSKTMDISTGNVVKRFVGVQCSKIVPVFSKNQLNLKASLSALNSFQGAVIASVTGAGPYTVNFDQTYDNNITGELVVGDLIRFYHAGSATVDATIASIPNGTSITTSTNPSPATTGDMMYLRPATPSFSLLNPFLWSNTQFCFGTTALLALQAPQTRLEQGSAWEIDYAFESDSGAARSGDADPASLPRTVAKSALNIKKFFDTPDDIINFNNQNKTACVIRHFAGSSNQYELRVTLNSLKTEDPLPKLKAKSINYADIKYHTQYDQTDAQQFSITVINTLASIA